MLGARSAGRGHREYRLCSSMGKVVNLLQVTTPAEEPQILLRVRFADVDRSRSSNLGFNLFSTGATGTLGGVTTQQFSPATLALPTPGQPPTATIANALNVFLYRPDLNLGATIEALRNAKNILQILAEPNVLAMNGKPASFVSGGEFPIPVVQGGANIGAVTIQFREFGVRLNFLPTITPRGTIRLQVAPEVSSLDYSNAVVLQGFTVPAIATRKVQTEIELENGQSFAIAGLLDRNFNETLNYIPGIGDIPLLGKLFQSRVLSKSNSELLIMVTPELGAADSRATQEPPVNTNAEAVPAHRHERRATHAADRKYRSCAGETGARDAAGGRIGAVAEEGAGPGAGKRSADHAVALDVESGRRPRGSGRDAAGTRGRARKRRRRWNGRPVGQWLRLRTVTFDWNPSCIR